MRRAVDSGLVHEPIVDRGPWPGSSGATSGAAVARGRARRDPRDSGTGGENRIASRDHRRTPHRQLRMSRCSIRATASCGRRRPPASRRHGGARFGHPSFCGSPVARGRATRDPGDSGTGGENRIASRDHRRTLHRQPRMSRCSIRATASGGRARCAENRPWPGSGGANPGRGELIQGAGSCCARPVEALFAPAQR